MGAWRPLLRFTAFQAGAIVAVTDTAWVLAGSNVLGWFPGNEAGFMSLGILLAALAAHLAGLRQAAQGAVAAGVATLLHVLVYYLPLLILLDARPNISLNRKMTEVTLELLLCYGVVIGLSLVAKALHRARAA